MATISVAGSEFTVSEEVAREAHNAAHWALRNGKFQDLFIEAPDGTLHSIPIHRGVSIAFTFDAPADVSEEWAGDPTVLRIRH